MTPYASAPRLWHGSAWLQAEWSWARTSGNCTKAVFDLFPVSGKFNHLTSYRRNTIMMTTTTAYAPTAVMIQPATRLSLSKPHLEAPLAYIPFIHAHDLPRSSDPVISDALITSAVVTLHNRLGHGIRGGSCLYSEGRFCSSTSPLLLASWSSSSS